MNGNIIDPKAMFSMTYGLFILTARDGDKQNGCVINTAIQITSDPLRISITVNKNNYTHDMIMKTGVFNLAVLSQSVPFSVFECFGFHTGRDFDKFALYGKTDCAKNGVAYLADNSSAVICAKVYHIVDCGTHTMFFADVTECEKLSDVPAVTYAYYFANIKPKPKPKVSAAKVYICRICGYQYDEAVEGVPFDSLPDDWLCPLCAHPKSDFELQK